jgi:hypothetical protein
MMPWPEIARREGISRQHAQNIGACAIAKMQLALMKMLRAELDQKESRCSSGHSRPSAALLCFLRSQNSSSNEASPATLDPAPPKWAGAPGRKPVTAGSPADGMRALAWLFTNRFESGKNGTREANRLGNA